MNFTLFLALYTLLAISVGIVATLLVLDIKKWQRFNHVTNYLKKLDDQPLQE